jgi:predicted nucleic acid-binding protein
LIVVVDTNVWISALVFSKPGSVPRQVLDRVVSEDKLATSEELRAEVHRF